MRITPEQVSSADASIDAAHRRDVEHTSELLARDGIAVEQVIAEVARFSVAAPSWALGTGGTRFGKFPGPGEPRTTEEKIEGAPGFRGTIAFDQRADAEGALTALLKGVDDMARVFRGHHCDQSYTAVERAQHFMLLDARGACEPCEQRQRSP